MQKQVTPEDLAKTLQLDVSTHGTTWGMKMLAAKKKAGVVCSLTKWGEGITRQYLPGRTWRNPVVRAGVTTYRDLAESLGLGVHVKEGKASDWLNEVVGAFGIDPISDISSVVSNEDAAKLGLSVVLSDAIQESAPTDITPRDEVGTQLAVALHFGKKQTQASPAGNSGTPSGGGCFVATAVFADAYSPEVCLLRTWREVILRRSSGGRIAVRGYRLVGPLLSRVVMKIPGLQATLRSLLRRFIIRVVGPSLVAHFPSFNERPNRDQ